MILKLKADDFDFLKTFNSGLFYFFYTPEPQRKILINPVRTDISNGVNKKIVLLKFFQKKDLYIEVDKELNKSELEFLKNRLIYCFGLNEDMQEFYRICRRDAVLRKFYSRIVNTRIISAFCDFEALVGAIVSQNNSYRGYRIQMKLLYEKTLFRKEKFLNAEKLRKYKIGYKADYLVELARNFGKIPLPQIKGIGRYSLGLFEIFQKRDYNSFYVDCLTEKILKENYGIRKNFEEAGKKLWGNWRGLALAYLQRFFEKK
ncbi:MAG: hypothetical protein J7L42_04540 [Elusimicrobia bacterium]|nr:hypothetical protein [Elusimicrobiota bacterium]